MDLLQVQVLQCDSESCTDLLRDMLDLHEEESCDQECEGK